MTFDPIDTLYCPPKTDGSYISNITNIAVYASTYQRLLKLDMLASYRQMYVLAIVYDFMAFCEQTFRDVLDERQGTARHLKGIRALIADTLHTIEASGDYTCNLHHLFNVFRAIVLEIGPIPCEDAIEDAPIDPRPHKFWTPRTLHTSMTPSSD